MLAFSGFSRTAPLAWGKSSMKWTAGTIRDNGLHDRSGSSRLKELVQRIHHQSHGLRNRDYSSLVSFNREAKKSINVCTINLRNRRIEIESKKRNAFRSLCSKAGKVEEEEDKKQAGSGITGNWLDTPFQARVFDLFELLDFNKSELGRAFDKLDVNQNGVIEREELDLYIRDMCENDVFCNMSDKERNAFVNKFMDRFSGGSAKKEITREQFDKVILELANTVDRRVWPITASMVLVGVAIGIMSPIMPLFVKELGLSTSDFGLVISAFAFSKLLGNIPCAFFADKYGRKRVMSSGLGLLVFGMGGIAFVDGLYGLAFCRLVSGLGASAFTTASMLYLVDIGTPFTRTKTMAPISAGFSAGAAVGPAIGGFLATFTGLSNTFFIVSGVFAALTGVNYFTLQETLKPARMGISTVNTNEKENKQEGLVGEMRNTVRQWKPLLADAKFRSILGMNLMYWIALSGSYMTLLPLLLVREELGLTPAQLGGVFAMTSAVNVICTQPSAWISDKFGKPNAIVASTLIISSSMFAFPLIPELTPALAVLGIWAAGGTLFGLAPTAYVADIVGSKHRSQALALLRTTGDVGLLCGASLTGLVADNTSQPFAMQCNSAALLASGAMFGLLTRRNGSTSKPL